MLQVLRFIGSQVVLIRQMTNKQKLRCRILKSISFSCSSFLFPRSGCLQFSALTLSSCYMLTFFVDHDLKAYVAIGTTHQLQAFSCVWIEHCLLRLLLFWNSFQSTWADLIPSTKSRWIFELNRGSWWLRWLSYHLWRCEGGLFNVGLHFIRRKACLLLLSWLRFLRIAFKSCVYL